MIFICFMMDGKISPDWYELYLLDVFVACWYHFHPIFHPFSAMKHGWNMVKPLRCWSDRGTKLWTLLYSVAWVGHRTDGPTERWFRQEPCGSGGFSQGPWWFPWNLNVGRWPKWPKIMANHGFIMVYQPKIMANHWFIMVYQPKIMANHWFIMVYQPKIMANHGFIMVYQPKIMANHWFIMVYQPKIMANHWFIMVYQPKIMANHWFIMVYQPKIMANHWFIMVYQPKIMANHWFIMVYQPKIMANHWFIMVYQCPLVKYGQIEYSKSVYSCDLVK